MPVFWSTLKNQAMRLLGAAHPFLVAAIALLLVLWAVFGVRSCRGELVADQASRAARQEQLAAVAGAARGEVHDQVVLKLAPRVLQADQAVARKRAKVARMEALPLPGPVAPAPQEPVPDPDGSASAAGAEIARLRALSDAKSELIEALTTASQEKDALITSLTAARDDYRTALSHATAQARLQEIAHEAKLAAVKAERWQGRAEGAALFLALKALL